MSGPEKARQVQKSQDLWSAFGARARKSVSAVHTRVGPHNHDAKLHQVHQPGAVGVKVLKKFLLTVAELEQEF